ncbi:MAG TPA: ABC transporter ATP-binding protein [Roseiflexaceae bacterium]|nr:ABC transporter ATP-binding protein [Roseiflexaceae bacterium]
MTISPTSKSPRLSTAAAAVQLEHVSVRYHLYYSERPQLQEYLAALVTRRPLRREVWALRDVSLQVRPGEVLGLCGSNGSGKSTLLKVVARILRPSSGRVVVRGKVAPLIELGAGFQPDLTGRENVILKSAILGHTEYETRHRMDQIIDFAGLREFIDAPLRTYSSGMVARLAFAVATDVQPDILIVDEVLAVGDAEFRERSEDRLEALRRSGATVLIVSHNSSSLRRMCDRLVWLAYGRIPMGGDPAPVLAAYEGGVRGHETDGGPGAPPPLPALLLPPEDTLFVLEPPDAIPTFIGDQIAAQFPAEQISPIQNRQGLTEKPIQTITPYRMVRGTFFFDQMMKLMQRPFITIATIGRASGQPAAQWRGVADRLTHLLGTRLAGNGIPHDIAYLKEPLTDTSFQQACSGLDGLALVTLNERPLESLLLLWYTFGWVPPARLPTPEADQAIAGAEPVSYDEQLYQRAIRRFERQYARMAQDLIETEGGPQLAGTQPPYPLELLHGLLLARSTRLQRATRRHVLRFSFDRPVPGTGWYGVEYNRSHGTFRWTGPEPQATIQLPLDQALAGADLMLRCRILLASRPNMPRTLRFRANNQPITTESTRLWDGSYLYEGRIPRTIHAGLPYTRILIDVGQTDVPAASGDGERETRRLGVAVSWLELEALPAESSYEP